MLIAQLPSSRMAVKLGLINSLALNVAALFLHYSPVFVAFIFLNLACAAARMEAAKAVGGTSGLQWSTGISSHVVTLVAWCALQGAMAFLAMRTGVPELRLLTAATVMALIGPVCARNYPAPRLAFLLVCLCDLPFVAGAILPFHPWALVLIIQTPIFMYGSLRVITHFHSVAVANLKAEYDSTQRSLHDPLTGLLNRAGLNEALRRREGAGQEHFVLLCLDLDGFKQINDTQGHPAGDVVLQAVARRLEACVRSVDSVVRLGGDEFVILAPSMERDVAAAFAERIIAHVGDEPYLLDGMVLTRIGVSIGFACAPEDGTEMADLHGKADFALYQAKASGKGRHRPFASAANTGPQTDRCGRNAAAVPSSTPDGGGLLLLS